MKIITLFLSVLIGLSAPAQSLKDALYSGKLKTDSGTVLRKGEDLTGKIDTARKKEVVPEKAKAVITPGEVANADTVAATMSTAAVSKDNNKIWKAYTDEVVKVLNQEVMTSKKIKKGDYAVVLDYEIGLAGEVSIKNVFVTPENSFINEQVKERFSIDTPKLNPVMTSEGKARKSVKRSNFTLIKE
ncbi:MAG TPA: hypothetical protein VGO58_14045 [Chitinophagaceae bacterium]|nr:hypothetical protein [Chitinophagaceae bacterium]